MLKKKIIPITALVTNVAKQILIQKIYKFSNMPDVLVLIYIPAIVLAGTQILFLCQKNKLFTMADFIIAFFFAHIYIIEFEEAYRFGFLFSFALRLALEAAGIIFGLLITEIVAGRKIRLERNTIVSLALIISLCLFYIQDKFVPSELVSLSFAYFFLLGFLNILKHVFVVAADPVKILLLSSAFALIISGFDYHEVKPFEFVKTQEEISAHHAEAILLGAVSLASFISNFLAFRYLEIDMLFILKLLHLVIFMIYSNLFDI